MKTRRQFMGMSIGVAATGAVAPTALVSCDSTEDLHSRRLLNQAKVPSIALGKPLPWINWARNQYCYPSKIYAAKSEDDVAKVFKETTGVVRPVGAGHSFSPVVPTNDVLISTDLMSGVVSSNNTTLEAELWAGTRIYDAARQLASIGQAFPNLPDMAYPSLAGSVACSVHGTGTQFGSISHYLTGLTLVTPTGRIIECSESENHEVFKAAQTSVGALGVISKLRFKNVKPFELTEVTRMADTNEVLDNIDEHFSSHRNFELFAFPLTSRCALVETNYAKPGDKPFGKDEGSVIHDLKDLYDSVAGIPFFGHKLYHTLFTSMEPENGLSTIRTGPSYEVLTHDRLTRFREMEYTVPVEFGPACLKQILKTISDKKLPCNIPIEYRHVKKDDVWISMFQGQDGASISIHQHESWDYKSVFAEIEPIFWKYNGRPHWGKIHTLDSKRLAKLYPDHWEAFGKLRRHLDPEGRMLNEHLKRVFV